jgi:hypothetical protein
MQTMVAKRRFIVGAAYAYLTLPVCLFFIGWLKPLLSVPMTGLFLFGLYQATRKFDTAGISTPAVTRRQWIVIALTLFTWVLLSGVGGLVWQNRDDHLFRNAVYFDLTNSAWPVVNTDEAVPRTLVYYFGFWLPSALFAKVFGVAAGYVFQFAWALIGTGLAFCLMSYWLRKFSWVAALLFIFFSGLDVVPSLLKMLYDGMPLGDIFQYYFLLEHIELFLEKFNSSCNTTLLFWLYNRIIPFWVGFMLLLLQRNNRHLLFTYALFALFCPFAMVGALPVLLYRIAQNEGITARNFKQKLGTTLKALCSPVNLAGVAQALIIAAFYATNTVAGNVGVIAPSVKNLLLYLLFFVTEFGVFLFWLYPDWKRNPLIWAMIATTTLCNFIVLGNHYDFGWRTGIPMMFTLMLLVTEKIIHRPKGAKLPKRAFLIVILILGAVTPGLEIARTVRNTAVITIYENNPDFFPDGSLMEPLKGQPFKYDFMPTSFARIPENRNIDNVTGTDSEDAFFNRYLRK